MKKTLTTLTLLGLCSAASAYTVVDSCDWNAPGANRYRGTVDAAVVALGMPTGTSDRLRRRISKMDYDEVVEIRRNSISGSVYEYDPQIAFMHFGGAGKICRNVDRSKWKADAVERGLVYCDGSMCVLVPTVCGNVSLIGRREVREVVTLPPVGSGAAFADPVPVSEVVETFAAEPAPAYMPVYATQTQFLQSPPLPILIYQGVPGPTVYVDHPGVEIPPMVTVPPAVVAAPVPEPSTYALLGAALLGLFFFKKGRRSV